MKKLFLILLMLLQFPVSFGSNQIQDPSSKKIIGTWYADRNRNTKWIFTQDRKIYNYDKDVFKVMYGYTISNRCQNNSSDTTEFLTFMDRDGNEFCFRINGIDENKNGILSLTKMDNGETLLFVNNLNVVTGK